MMKLRMIDGFLAAGTASGVKKSGRRDLGLIFCPDGAAAAGMFTTNRIQAAPVELCRKHATGARAFGAVINSGNANACTGKTGAKNAMYMCRAAARHFGCRPEEVLIASTGIIGHPLDMQKIYGGIDQAGQNLSASAAGFMDFARAILTTDRRAKWAQQEVRIGSKTVRMLGTAKGAGMIAPNMATTIAVLLTDAEIPAGLLRRALKEAIGQSLNKLTVDGHQSTNDTALILASGKSGVKIRAGAKEFERFTAGLTELCRDLAVQMALDAEGSRRCFTVNVRGAKTKVEAQRAARAVADYDLLKCAIHGRDPNWGRIICAVGSCGVSLRHEKLSCRIGDVLVFSNGSPCRFDRKKASEVIAREHHTISIDLGAGKYADHCLGCELSRGYVRINADYHT